MRLRMLALGIAAIASQLACSGDSTVAPQGKLDVSICTDDGTDCAINTLLRDGSTVTIKVAATDASGGVGTGVVTLTPLAGSVNGKTSDSVTLDSTGTATALYACDASLDSKCTAATSAVSIAWNSVKGIARLTLVTAITGSDGGTTDAGLPTLDAGPSTSTSASINVASVVPQSIASQGSSGTGLPTAAEVSFYIYSGTTSSPVVGVNVTFATPVGESLLALSSGSATTDANGVVTVLASSRTALGIGHVIASLPLGFASAEASVGIFGPPASIVEVSQLPLTGVLGLKGSGIQEQGLMTFLVTDAFGTPVPDAVINFTQNQPQLISLNSPSGTTDEEGHVSIAYSSGTEVGVTSITATFPGTAAAGVHTVAVRGARPSASGLYFRCDHGSLPVYDVITDFSTTTCHVRLSDRFGNRVGIATPVNFATEAGAISASALTTPFDLANPESDAEGTVDVTFSTDMGNGSSPADVIPLEADTNPNQYPLSRSQIEPRETVGGQVRNPRDQLVTIIAWTQGEEAFVDANHNGQYDQGELFVDEGDPYLDENDDNQYDQVVPNGQWEPRFCGTTTSGACPAYQAPNGKWDSQTTIWAPTWMVFGGSLTVSPDVFGAPSAPAFTPSDCADYIDAPDTDGLHSPVISSPVYAYDRWGNTPTVGTTLSVPTTSFTGGLLNEGGEVSLIGTAVEGESFGAFGALFEGFTYGPVSALTGGPCIVANGTQCVYNLHFDQFDLGDRGTVVISNGVVSNLSAATNGNHYAACPPPQTGVLTSPIKPESFSLSVVTSTPLQSGETVAGYGFLTGTIAAVSNAQ